MPDAYQATQLAARLTGWSPLAIRIWEQRGHAVGARRTSANHRPCSPGEVDPLRSAVRPKQARAFDLGLVYLEDNARLPGESTSLRESLPAEVPVLVGGRAVPVYRERLVRFGAILAEDLLNQVRGPGHLSCAPRKT